MNLYVWYVADYGATLSAVAVARTLKEARVLAAVTVKQSDVYGNSLGPELLDAVRNETPDVVKPLGGVCAAAW